jgi:hypothetical protein
MTPVNVSYPVPARWAQLEAIAGPRFTPWKKVQEALSGRPVGSARVQWTHCSDPGVQALLDSTQDVKWLNLERTAGGMLLYFRVRLETYAIAVARSTPVTLGKSAPGSLEVHIGKTRCVWEGTASAITSASRILIAH